MTLPSQELPPAAARTSLEIVSEPPTSSSGVPELARAILVMALAMGVAADLLLRDGFTGRGYPLWLALVSLGTLALVARAGREMTREAGSWLVVAVLFGAAMAWRSAEVLQFLDFLATLLALGMAAIAIGAPDSAVLAARLRETAWAGITVIRSTAAGLVPLLFRDLELSAPSPELRGRVRPGVRAAGIALPLVIVFGALLRDADPVFASLVALPELDLERIATHVIPIGFFTWVVAGWARGSLIVDHARRRPPERMPFTLGALDLTTALGALNVLFALYLLTQLGWLFGGERFLQERTGLTAAEYARRGFFQMVWVVLLVVPVLLATRAMLRPGRELERRHTALAVPLVVLLGLMIVSALLRMRLYVHYYGLTTERFYPLVFMIWLAVVLVWLALTVLRGVGRRFVAGAVFSGLSMLAMLNVFVPDVIVARVNIARAGTTSAGGRPALDLRHLSRLSGEAVPLVLPMVLAPPSIERDSVLLAGRTRERCDAASRLLAWRPSGEELARREADGAAWRSRNWGAARAERFVVANAPALRTLLRGSCPRPVRRASAQAGR